MVYAPGTLETDQKKQNMALQQQAKAITTATDDIATNTTNIATNTANIATNTANIATNTTNITNLTPGHLFGLTLSTAGSSATFSVAAGSAADSTGTAVMALASAISKTTSAWAVGTGNGALDTGSIANNTWYHVFLIKRTDTDVEDVLVSTSASSPTMPTSYTLKRRIGSMKTNGSAQWIGFVQLGDKFLWNTQLLDVAGSTSIGTANVATTLTVPTGVYVEAWIVVAVSGTGANAAVLVSSPLVSQTDGSTAGYHTAYANVAGQYGFTDCLVITNTSAQVNISNSVAAPGNTVYVNTRGWVDRRGRDA